MAARFGSGRPSGATRLLCVSQMSSRPSPSESTTFVLKTIALNDRQLDELPLLSDVTVTDAEPVVVQVPGRSSLTFSKVGLSHLSPFAPTNGFVAIRVLSKYSFSECE